MRSLPIRAVSLSLCLAAACLPAARAPAAERVVSVGAGSLAALPPAGAKEPQAEIYRTEAARGPMPTTDWWSSVAWMPYSERQYPHPLAVRCTAKGLRVYYPGPDMRADRAAIFGFMPEPGGGDLVLGHSAQAEFPDARVDGWSDWFVRVAFVAGDRAMRVSYGHGSPFVYALYEKGAATVTFPDPPAVWAGAAKDAVLGVTVRGRHYGLFGPTGATWSGLGTKVLVCDAAGKPYFSLALLPDAKAETLALFRRHAYAHVVDTKVAWRYERKEGAVATTFTFTTRAFEGKEAATLFALYPHQWRYTSLKPLDLGYDSVRGRMKLARGSTFTTRTPLPGVLPALPPAGPDEKAALDPLLDEEARAPVPGPKDIYWEGKWLGKMAALVPLAEETGNATARQKFLDAIRGRLETWFTATDGGRPKSAALFYYSARWGALVGYPSAFGADTALNDHHFHYGYFIRAAAEVARGDPAWAAPGRWGGMVDLLVRDIAAGRRDDPQFPFLRCFDPYAGHSWASGDARFGDGNNQESSSEAMNAWYGLILWGEATGDANVRDLGLYLYATELAAVEEYWFDVHGSNFPATYTPSVVTMVWGGKGANGTWFSANPEMVHGINWLPIHGGSLYLGRYPEYVRKNYDALVAENRGTAWDAWADLVWMYRALADPDDAWRQFQAAGPKAPLEAGNSRANVYHWIQALRTLGQVDRTVTADHPLCAVFLKGGERTHVVYNMQDRPLTATFSDGVRVTAKGRGFAVAKAAAGGPRR